MLLAKVLLFLKIFWCLLVVLVLFILSEKLPKDE